MRREQGGPEGEGRGRYDGMANAPTLAKDNEVGSGGTEGAKGPGGEEGGD